VTKILILDKITINTSVIRFVFDGSRGLLDIGLFRIEVLDFVLEHATVGRAPLDEYREASMCTYF
jgi:hypothetical protein